MIKRFASTSAISPTFLPSVSWLIHKFKLSNDIVSTIPTSGPKSRLLKGDILAFLKEASHSSFDLDALLEAEAYHSINVHISNSHKKSISEIGNLIALSAVSEMYGKGGICMTLPLITCLPGLSPKVTTFVITKQGLFGNTDFALKIDPESAVTASTIANLKGQNSIQAVPGSFRFVDSLCLDDRYNDAVHHITKGETAVLSVSRQANHQNQSQDIVDLLAFPSVISPRNSDVTNGDAAIQKEDFLDFLAPSHTKLSHIQLDLTVDSRLIPDKVALSFLRRIKSHLESNL